MLPLSVCIIYGQDDIAKVSNCLKFIPDGTEICKVRTVPVYDKREPKLIYQNTEKYHNSIIKHAIFEYHYKDFDFSLFRNAAMSLAERDWILWLDSDDELFYVKEDFESVFNLPKEIGAVALTVLSHYYFNDSDESISIQPLRQLKLFRNHKGIKYAYSVHEHVNKSVTDLGLRISPSDIIIRHTGYWNISVKDYVKKLERNLNLVIDELAKDKTNQFMWDYLYLTVNDINRHGIH